MQGQTELSQARVRILSQAHWLRPNDDDNDDDDDDDDGVDFFGADR